MKETEILLEKKIEDLESSIFGWVVCLNSKSESDTAAVKDIIVDLTIELTAYKHDLKLIQSAQGLNARTVCQIVDHYIENGHKL